MNTSNNIPFNFYDHVAIIFPGFLLLALFTFLLNKLEPSLVIHIIELKKFSSPLLIFSILVLSYISGNVLYSVAKQDLTTHYKIHWQKMRIRKFKPNVDKFLDFSEVQQKEIINEVGKIYGEEIYKELNINYQKYLSNEITGSEFGLKNYCYALVERKEAKHDTFTALADFLRSTSFVVHFANLYLVSPCLSYIKKGEFFNAISIVLIMFLVNRSGAVLSLRSIRMRKAADSVIYNQFLLDAKTKAI